MNHFLGNVKADAALQFGSPTEGRSWHWTRSNNLTVAKKRRHNNSFGISNISNSSFKGIV